MGDQHLVALGVDTGGTYTDAVLYDETAGEILAKAKSPTTHEDLSVGIAGAVDEVLGAVDIDIPSIAMVSLSTTLATNALVAGVGRPACLVVIGFEPGVVDRAGLREAIGNDTVVRVDGGHSSHGDELMPLDTAALAAAVDEANDSVDAFAVTAQFSTRNTDHEEQARDLIRELTGKPVTCSHVLSAQLNGPKRAVTALLNARLIPLISDLLAAAAQTLGSRGITAPLMIMRGNGSLVSAEFVRERPVETILSGPAASVVGAAHLVSADQAVVADMGGTTTDIAVVYHGTPLTSADGAVVGGHRTMVEAVRTRTHGLGGDSEVSLADRAYGADLDIGPRRVIPIGLLASGFGGSVVDTLARQLDDDVIGADHGRFVRCTEAVRHARLDRFERQVAESIGDQPMPLTEIVTSGLAGRAVRRLTARSLLQVSSITPTDAAHVLGMQSAFDPEASRLAAELLARRRDRYGEPIADSATEISQIVVDSLVRLSAEMLLAAAFAGDGISAEAVASKLVAHALDGRTSNSRVDVGLAVPVIGLGAPAGTYLPLAGALLKSEVRVPEHAEVANALGAAVGRVEVLAEVQVSCPRRGVYRIHAGSEPETLWELHEAESRARELARAEALGKAEQAGAVAPELSVRWHAQTIEVKGRPMFVEGRATALATGRPGLPG